MLKVISIFVTIFLAELGDKTQLATVLFATDRNLSPFVVFLAAASALVASSALAVAIGSIAARHIDALPLKLIAGVLFIAIGGWQVIEHFRTG